jgi:ABC-type transporter Mla maintaining outer membrane lipid asymmetry permease subunit MlaE
VFNALDLWRSDTSYNQSFFGFAIGLVGCLKAIIVKKETGVGVAANSAVVYLHAPLYY